MNEFLYGQSSVLIVGGLLLLMLLAMEAGFRRGRQRQRTAADSVRDQVNTALASMLGLLALLLGFTFSLALQRYDDRSQAVVNEANAIGTAWLRVQLLPAAVRADTETTMRQYLNTRIAESSISLADEASRQELLVKAEQQSNRLWANAVKAADVDPRPITAGLFLQAMNDLIDAAGKNNAALNRHVPEIVFYLLFFTLLLAAATLGYASGLAGHRVTLAAVALVILIAVVAYLIIDLDRPRRGTIQVNQDSLLSLQQSMKATPAQAPLPQK